MLVFIRNMRPIYSCALIFGLLHYVRCQDCNLDITKTLNNGIILEKSKWSKVRISCLQDGNALAVVSSPHTNQGIRIYFANNDKNILVVNMSENEIIGYKYETPHKYIGKMIGERIIKTDDIMAWIPHSWFPPNITRMSATIRIDEEIHSYYGLLNYPISIPDVMVVDEYKKVKCCLTELKDNKFNKI